MKHTINLTATTDRIRDNTTTSTLSPPPPPSPMQLLGSWDYPAIFFLRHREVRKIAILRHTPQITSPDPHNKMVSPHLCSDVVVLVTHRDRDYYHP
mmetsp:Transcript_28000/g.31461  ORF Transcript_28000/g.31461 Transcript_28000/m.31461 type:complete len:96 (+) Transcript_28000:25-312(+)